MKRGRQEEMTSVARSLLSKWDHDGGARRRAGIVQSWRLVAGPEVYSHARGFALRDGELVVFVDTHTWATELAAMSEHYRAALNMVIGQETVTSLRFAVSKKVRDDVGLESDLQAQDDERRPEMVTPVPVSELEIDQVRMMASGIHDDKIREAVVSAAIAHLEWRKGIEARNAAERALQRARGTDSTAHR